MISACSANRSQISVTTSQASHTSTSTARSTLPPLSTPFITPTRTITPPAPLGTSPAEKPIPSVAAEIDIGAAKYLDPQLLYCKQDGCIYSVTQPLLRPLPAEYEPKVEKTYRYGSTQNGTRENHAGVEFPADRGTPVIASADGIVFYAGDDQSFVFGPFKNFYGNLVLLEHHWDGLNQSVYTVYAHLSQIMVETGDHVVLGQEIGEVGSSGSATGAHLHFEVRVNGTALSDTVNPELWLNPSQIEKANSKQTCGTLIARFTKGEGTIYSNAVLIQNFSDSQADRKPSIDAESYAKNVPTADFWNENLVVGDLSPGIYRISLVRNNQIYQKFFEIESERITLVEFDFVN